MITYCTSPGATFARASAAPMAWPPSCAPLKSLSEPSKRPIGVRAPATITEPDMCSSSTPGPSANGARVTITGRRDVGFRAGRKQMINRIDHVGLAVRDLDASIAFYERTFGMHLVHEEVNEEQ